MALLVGPSHPAELRLEQVVALESLELLCHLPLATAGDLRHRDLAVVVTDLPRHAPDKTKRPIVALEERLCALPREGLDVQGVGVRQRHHEQGNLLPLTGDIDVGEPKVHLRLARRVRERNEYLLRGRLPLLYGVFHHRVAAGIAPFHLQPVEDPLRRVPLLLGLLLVLLQHLMDPRDVWSKYRLLTLRLPPISRRLNVREHLPQRSPINAVLLARGTLRQLAG